MAFDHENHTTDAAGFQVHKETGHMIGIEAAPFGRVSEEKDYPKWVVPHDSHLQRRPGDGVAPDHISAPHFADVHVSRHDGAVTVLVHSAEEEAKALAAFEASAEHKE